MRREIVLAGGCFWGVQRFFQEIEGVEETEAGYANGRTETARYEDIAFSGHAEAVRIVYEDKTLSLGQLLRYFFMIVDPTARNRQGNDRGPQYRSGIYYTAEEDLQAIGSQISEEQRYHRRPIVTEVEPLRHFIAAEPYHQDYLLRHPHGYCHVDFSVLERIRGTRKEERKPQ